VIYEFVNFIDVARDRSQL